MHQDYPWGLLTEDWNVSASLNVLKTFWDFQRCGTNLKECHSRTKALLLCLPVQTRPCYPGLRHLLIDGSWCAYHQYRAHDLSAPGLRLKLPDCRFLYHLCYRYCSCYTPCTTLIMLASFLEFRFEINKCASHLLLASQHFFIIIQSK